MSVGLQFTSRMAPQPLGPQTQFFCKDRNVVSGRCQANPAFQKLPASGEASSLFSRVTGTSRSVLGQNLSPQAPYRNRKVTPGKCAKTKGDKYLEMGLPIFYHVSTLGEVGTEAT